MNRFLPIGLIAVLLGQAAIARCAADIDAAGIAKARNAVVAESAVLRKLIDQDRSAGKDTAYPRAALAIATRFLRLEPLKLKNNRIEEAGVDMERSLPILNDAIADLKRGHELKVPTPSMKGLTLNGPNFYSGKDPVMLLGPMGWGDMWEDLDEIRELGFDVMDDESACSAGEFQALMLPPGSFGQSDPSFDQPRAYPIKTSWRLLEALNMNTALTFSPDETYVPGWVYELYPETKPDGTWRGTWINAPLESPNMRELLATYYAGIVPLTKDEPRLLLYWLKNEPTYWSHSPMYLDMFRTHLREKYESVDALNAAWGTTFKTFEEAAWPSEDNKPGWYDWCDFHYDHVTEFFAWQRDQIKKSAPNAITSNKPMTPTMCLPDRNDEVGIDFEAQAEIYEVPGCDNNVTYDMQDIASRLVGNGPQVYDFWKSVSPNKPFANLEQHNIEDQPEGDRVLEYSHSADEAFRYTQFTCWQQFLHGLRLNEFWLWSDSENAATYCPLTMQPTVLYATSKAALDLRRLARYVALFPGKSETAIYFSKPSLFLDASNYSPVVRNVYAGLYFLDAPVGFITDKMILKGIDKNIKFLIIPEARYVSDDVYSVLENYARSGGRLFIVGPTSLSRDEKDRQRDVQSLKNLPNVTWIDSGKDAKWFWETFDKVMDTSGVTRPVRVTDDAGNPVWEIESRTIESAGKRFTYLINMSSEDQKVQLRAASKIGGIRDLIADENVNANSFVLKPFDLKFLELR